MLEEWPFYALKSAYYASQESQVVFCAPNYIEVIFDFSQFHVY